VCMFAYNSGKGGAIVSKFQGAPGMVLRAKICACLGPKFGERVMGRGHKIGIFFSRDLAGTGQAIGAHTSAGGQCTLRR